MLTEKAVFVAAFFKVRKIACRFGEFNAVRSSGERYRKRYEYLRFMNISTFACIWLSNLVLYISVDFVLHLFMSVVFVRTGNGRGKYGIDK